MNRSISKSLKSCQKWLYLSMKPIDLTPLIWVDPFDKHPDPTTPSVTAVTEDPISTPAMANTTAPILIFTKVKSVGCKQPHCEAEVLALERLIFHKNPIKFKMSMLASWTKHANPPRSCHDGVQHGQNLWFLHTRLINRQPRCRLRRRRRRLIFVIFSVIFTVSCR